MRERPVDVLCGYALEVVVSALRGVRGFLGRLLTGDDRSAIGPAAAVAPARPWAGRDRLPDEARVRGAIASSSPLPETYADDRLVLLARDPRTLFAYWDLTPWTEQPAHAAAARLVLRIEDLTLLDFEQARPWRHEDVPVERLVGSHYVELDHGAGTFRAEIGWRWPDGSFVARVRSEVVAAPRADTPGHDPVRWLTARPAAPGDPRLSVQVAPAPATAPNGALTAADSSRRRAPSSEASYRRGK